MFVFFWRKKRLFLIAALILLVICIYTAAFASEQVVQRKKPIYQGVPAKKQVSITVNVDWGEEHLSAMLEVLQKSRVKATFFMTGRWAGEHPELVNKIARLGHEIGNHGYSHPHVNDLPLEQNIEEIKKTSDVIYRAAQQKTRYFAPPYGEFNDTVIEAASQTGHRIILWTVDTVDWQKPPPAEITSRVLDGIQNGGIILMHPTEQTTQALPEMIKRLREKGYQIVPLEKLIAG
ncbi:MAG: polysaccharide deacetylase family protein [Syntrophaceticus schinkii]|nr:polysaccharide deacetylase family protein [Syntrophaceticus schinkii]